MKKSILWISVVMLIMMVVPSAGSYAAAATKTNPVSARDAAEAKVLLSRLEEIKGLDKSTLTSSEKKLLRKEVRASRARLNDIGGGVYLSVGVLLIILILILIL